MPANLKPGSREALIGVAAAFALAMVAGWWNLVGIGQGNRVAITRVATTQDARRLELDDLRKTIGDRLDVFIDRVEQKLDGLAQRVAENDRRITRRVDNQFTLADGEKLKDRVLELAAALAKYSERMSEFDARLRDLHRGPKR